MPLFLFIFIFYNIHTFIQSQYIDPSPFAEASLHNNIDNEEKFLGPKIHQCF